MPLLRSHDSSSAARREGWPQELCHSERLLWSEAQFCLKGRHEGAEPPFTLAAFAVTPGPKINAGAGHISLYQPAMSEQETLALPPVRCVAAWQNLAVSGNATLRPPTLNQDY